MESNTSEADSYDDNENLDEVDEDGLMINDNFKFPPTQVIGNQIIDARGRPQSAKVQGKHNISGTKTYQVNNEKNSGIKYPVNAYQYNPNGMGANKNSGMTKGKRPMSASIAGRSGWNRGNYQVVGNTLTSHNSKMPTEYSKIDIKRMKPKRINQEKEQLYDQSIHYMKTSALLRLANNNEITTIGRLRNVMNKRQSESFLTIALKRQVKELKYALKEKEDEINAFKK